MKFWFGSKGWGWNLWGVSYKDKWFFGFSKQAKQPSLAEVIASLRMNPDDWRIGDTNETAKEMK